MESNFKNLYPKPEIIALFTENNFPYQANTMDKKYERWYNKVKKKPNKITYRVDQIYRVKVLNTGAEKIVYNETITGQDHNDNELEFDHVVGKWDKPIFRKQYDEETEQVISQEIHRYERVYDIDYDPEKILELAARGMPDTLSLVVEYGSKKYGGTGVFSLEEFAYLTSEQLLEKGRTGKTIAVEIPTAAKKPKQ